MPQLTSEDLLRIVVLAAVLLGVAFPVHEFCHAWMANRLGDSTARYMGRLSLNPVRHFDPWGGGILLLTLLLSGGTFAIGAFHDEPVKEVLRLDKQYQPLYIMPLGRPAF